MLERTVLRTLQCVWYELWELRKIYLSIIPYRLVNVEWEEDILSCASFSIVSFFEHSSCFNVQKKKEENATERLCTFTCVVFLNRKEGKESLLSLSKVYVMRKVTQPTLSFIFFDFLFHFLRRLLPSCVWFLFFADFFLLEVSKRREIKGVERKERGKKGDDDGRLS